MLDSIPTMLLASIAIFIGFIGLIWSADRFVAGAASIAEGFGIAPLIVGLTIVSFGTSAPEVMVSIIAAFKGAGDLAVGNALGSNIANIALVLGVTTLISLIPVDSKIFKHEGLVLILITLLSGYILFDTQVSPFEGWLLLLLLIPVMWYLVVMKQRDYTPAELTDDDIEHYETKIAIVWFVIGLVALIVSSKLLVWGAETTALYFNVSPLVIGLTVIAIGTSLPELAASVMSALKGHHDIAVGNIVGSNIFNILAVMSIPGIVGSAPMEASVFSRDYMVMLGVTLLLGLCIAIPLVRKSTPSQIGRFTGTLLLGSYIAYMYMIAAPQLAG